MASTQQEARRIGRLHGIFRDMLSGERTILTPKDAELFFEAIRIQKNPSTCLESIIAGKHGLKAVKASVRANLKPHFVYAHTFPFLRYMSDPTIKSLGDGQLLHKLVAIVVEPPTLWDALLGFFKGNQIKDDNLFPFVWLALEALLLPGKMGVNLSHDIEAIADRSTLQESQDHAVRDLSYRIKNILQLRSSPQKSAGAGVPGGRHDNDHTDFRDISIYPTTDEFLSTQQPFYRTVVEVSEADVADRPGLHIDNQFRLLREDMLAELREDLQVAIGAKKAKRPLESLSGLEPVAIDVGDSSSRFKKCTLRLRCSVGLQFLNSLKPEHRKKFLTDNANCLKHQSFGVLLRDNEILGFAFVERDIDQLARSPPIVCLQFTDGRGFRNALLALKLQMHRQVRFVLVGTPVFAYEPVLTGLKEITDLPLSQGLLQPESGGDHFVAKPTLQMYVTKLRECLGNLDTHGTVELPASIPKVRVDASQLRSMILALTEPVALIQGPPGNSATHCGSYGHANTNIGTGKSFIGAQVAKHLHRAGLRILVISFTNHALNQFLEDLMDVGIPEEDMVRVGGSKNKCTDRTAPLHLSEQRRAYRASYQARNIIGNMKGEAEEASNDLKNLFNTYLNASLAWKDISEYLEFSEEHCYDALLVPSGGNDSGWRHAGKRGKEVRPDYLYQRWIKGEDPGIFRKGIPTTSDSMWDMSRPERERLLNKWKLAMTGELVGSVEKLVADFNDIQGEIDNQFKEADRSTLAKKTVISCTTTGAAIYSNLIRAAKPDVVLVEEAGEILESHILTALAPTVKQVILIGDHKQLRPKINNYMLSVEKGDGFDLNCSLFERLIMQGATHTTLHKQHRMAKEISCFPRALTYPELLDGPNTHDRPVIRGLQNRVIFVNHGKQEDSDNSIKDRRDPTLKESKKNPFEAEMVLRCVKYLGQQGYSNNQIVVLAPYLGQIRVLQKLLRDNQHDPELSEMDKMELIRAGLISEAAAKLDKKPLRLSTVGMYREPIELDI